LFVVRGQRAGRRRLRQLQLTRMIRQTFPGSIRSVGSRGFRFTLVTPQVARDGHSLLPGGMDLRDYKRNPVVLFSHMHEKPVARCTSIGLVDGEIRGAAEFPPEGTSPQADEVCQLVKNSIVNAMSCGFDIVEAEPLDPKKGSRGGLRILRSTLIEASIVACPADTGAMITQRSAMSSKLIRASEAVDEAARVHHDLGRAIRHDDYTAALRHHHRLSDCLERAERCPRGLSDNSELEAQVSGGMSSGASGRGLTYAERQAAVIRLFPSPSQRAAEAAALRPRAPVWNGGSSAHWTAAMREYLESDALARSRSYICPLPLSHAQRAADLARLARSE